jgi:hypothetical protein
MLNETQDDPGAFIDETFDTSNSVPELNVGISDPSGQETLPELPIDEDPALFEDSSTDELHDTDELPELEPIPDDYSVSRSCNFFLSNDGSILLATFGSTGDWVYGGMLPVSGNTPFIDYGCARQSSQGLPGR